MSEAVIIAAPARCYEPRPSAESGETSRSRLEMSAESPASATLAVHCHGLGIIHGRHTTR